MHLAILDDTSLFFHARAHSHAYIALTSMHGVTNTMTYELGIGIDNNEKTVLRVRLSLISFDLDL